MKQSAMPPLSVVVPTLNEAESLPLLLERIYNTLYAAHIPFEIIIIDDHSTDATADVAQSADAKYQVRFMLKDGKQGKAYSLQQGFDAARYDIICMIDADLQYPPEAINRMYHKLVYCNADIVITNRISQQTSILRKLVTKVFHLVFTRALFGIDYDTQSGLKLFKKRVLKDVTITPSPWTFDLEFIVRSLENKYVILSEDIIFAKRYAGTAKIHIISATFEMAWQSLKLRRTVAAKRVKLQYRMLQPLQQSFNWLAVLVLGLVFAVGVAATKSASAAPLIDVPIVNQVVTKLKDSLVQPSITQPPTGTLAVASTTDPAQITPAPTNPDNTTTTDTTTASASTTASSNNSNPAKSSPSTNTKSNTDLQTGNGANDDYYSSSKISNSRTNRWLSLSLRILVVGIGLVGLALVIVLIRSVIKKVTRSHRSHRNPVLGEQMR